MPQSLTCLKCPGCVSPMHMLETKPICFPSKNKSDGKIDVCNVKGGKWRYRNIGGGGFQKVHRRKQLTAPFSASRDCITSTKRPVAHMIYEKVSSLSPVSELLFPKHKYSPAQMHENGQEVLILEAFKWGCTRRLEMLSPSVVLVEILPEGKTTESISSSIVFTVRQVAQEY